MIFVSLTATQPDWNQNDDTRPDYVKNRPFYTGDPVETVLVEESTVSFAADDSGMYMGQLESTFSATVGETYKVSWDGTVYESTCADFSGRVTIGNLSLKGAGSDTGEPFLMIVDNGRGIVIGTADTASSHTISISWIVTPVIKIDPKYIRDMYYTADPVETVFVEERTVAFADTGEGIYAAKFETTFVPTVGETYKVSWDGTVYECACVAFRKTKIIGNLSLKGAGSDTGEPFLMVVDNGRGIVIGTADTASSHTISISWIVTPVIKIDPKYLPTATNDIPGISKLAIRVIDTNKDYTMEEVTEIYKNIKSGLAIYYLRNNYIENVTGNISDSSGHITFRFVNGRYAKFTPTSGVWNFHSLKIIPPSTISIYHGLGEVEMNLSYNNVGGYQEGNMPAVGCDYSTKGFVGDYIQANSALVLKMLNATKYLWIDADSTGGLYVHTRNRASTSDLSKTQIAMISDIPTEDRINELINNALSAIGIAEEGAY